MTEPLDFGYDSYLGQVPESLRDQIEPAFKQYRENLENGYNSYAEKYKPYAEIEEMGWTPEHVGLGLNVLQQLNTQPQTVVDAIVQEHPEVLQQYLQSQGIQSAPQFSGLPGNGINGQPGQGSVPGIPQGQNNGGSSDFDVPPALQQRLDQQEQVIQLIYKGLQQQQEDLTRNRQQEQEQQELQQFNQMLDKIAPQDKFHRPLILSYISQGMEPDQAVKSYQEFMNTQQAQWRGGNAPLVAPGSGGGMPTEPVDTSKLSMSDRKNLIVQVLEAANRQ